MFYKIFVHENSGGQAAFLGQYDSIESAAASRAVSGDLIVWADTLKIVECPTWLWGWEIFSPTNSYAHRKIAESFRVTGWLAGCEPDN